MSPALRPSVHHAARSRRVASLLTFAALAGCGDLATDGAGPAVRDSAGVVIVEHPERAPSAAEVSGTPDLVIGGEEVSDAYRLVQVGALLPLPSGNVLVSELATNQLRFYDAGGRHYRTITGTSGPGLFTGVTSLWMQGDSIVVADQRIQRLLYYDTAGTYLKVRSYSSVFAIDTPVADRVCWNPILAGLMDDDARVAVGWSCADGEEGLRQARTKIRLIRANRRDSIGTFTTSPVWVRGDSPDAWLMPPFPAQLSWAVGGDHVYVSRGEEYRVEVYDSTGHLVRILAEEGEPPEVSRDDREAFLATAPEGYPQEMPFPERFPAYAQLMLDDEGNVWALRHPLGDEERMEWTVFSPDGESRRRVVLPAASWRTVAGGRAWGVRMPARNVSRVVAFDLDG